MKETNNPLRPHDNAPPPLMLSVKLNRMSFVGVGLIDEEEEVVLDSDVVGEDVGSDDDELVVDDTNASHGSMTSSFRSIARVMFPPVVPIHCEQTEPCLVVDPGAGASTAAQKQVSICIMVPELHELAALFSGAHWDWQAANGPGY